jgi:hypothetical protein
MVQSTIRFEAELLREAQYYLSLEDISVNKFMTERLQEFVRDYRQAHPDRVPGGVKSCNESRSSP